MKLMDDNERVGQMLQRARESKKITQEDMAHYLDISKNHISKLERGVCKATIRVLLAYCDKTGLTPNDILCVTTNNKMVIPELMELLCSADVEEQKTLYKIEKALRT